MSSYRSKRKGNDEDDFIDDDEVEEESSSDGEGNARKKATAKKSRKGEGKESAGRKAEEKIDPSTGITACMMSKNRKVVVRNFKNMTLIDIREYYSKDGDDLKPSKKGISLSVDQWKVLSESVSKVNEAIKEMS